MHRWAVSSPVMSCVFCEGSWPGQLGDVTIQHHPGKISPWGSYTSLATFQICLPLSKPMGRAAAYLPPTFPWNRILPTPAAASLRETLPFPQLLSLYLAVIVLGWWCLILEWLCYTGSWNLPVSYEFSNRFSVSKFHSEKKQAAAPRRYFRVKLKWQRRNWLMKGRQNNGTVLHGVEM